MFLDKKLTVLVSGKAHRVGVKGTESSFIEHRFQNQVQKDILPIKDHRTAASLIFRFIQENKIDIESIGHRFVHGGSQFQTAVLLDNPTLKRLQASAALAPLHNPISLSVIDESKQVYPSILQYATFDTAFHSTIPEYASIYPLPRKIIQQFGFRKFGFHGLSYSYVTQKVPEFLNIPVTNLKIVACHLGTGGSSVAAIKAGHSIDTSMGYSPLPGLMMSTRSGDIDPMLMIYLMAVYGYRSEALEELLNKQSGILGVSGFSSDLRDVIHRIDTEQESQAELALTMYIYRLRKYIGSYIIALGGIDALVFTDDIGVKNWLVREQVCASMGWAGIKLDKPINQQAPSDTITKLNSPDSSGYILSIPTNEEYVIARDGISLLNEKRT
ncbi:MAG: acetate/propionate family kinase [bacterium]